MALTDLGLLTLVTVSFVLEAIVGFGSTVVVVTLGAHFLPLDALLPRYVPVSLVLSIWLMARGFGTIAWGVLLRRVLPFTALGMGLGLSVPGTVDRRWLLGGFGLLVTALAAPEVRAFVRRLRSGGSQGVPVEVVPLSRPLAAVVLTGAGVVHGLFGSGGPLVVYYLGREMLDKSVFRATLSTLWVVLSVVLCVSFVERGVLTVDVLGQAAPLLLAVVLGGAIGERLHARVDVQVFRMVVFSVLALAGISLALRNLLAS